MFKKVRSSIRRPPATWPSQKSGPADLDLSALGAEISKSLWRRAEVLKGFLETPGGAPRGPTDYLDQDDLEAILAAAVMGYGAWGFTDNDVEELEGWASAVILGFETWQLVLSGQLVARAERDGEVTFRPASPEEQQQVLAMRDAWREPVNEADVDVAVWS